MATAEVERDGLRRLTAKFPNDHPNLARYLNLMFIPAGVLQEFMLLLNIKDVINATKDYQGLGNHFGLDTVEILNIGHFPHPAKLVLFEGVKKGKSFLDLLVFLIENKVDGLNKLLDAWPATLKAFRAYEMSQAHMQVPGQGQFMGQGHGQGHGQNARVPTESSWNCPPSELSYRLCSLSQNDLNYAESVFSDIENSQYPTTSLPVENRKDEINDWINKLNISPSSSSNFHTDQGNPNTSPEIVFNIRDSALDDQRSVDNDQTLSKSIEADFTNPNIVMAPEPGEDIQMEDIATYLLARNGSRDRDSHGNESLDRDSHGSESLDIDSHGNQSLNRDRHGNQSLDRDSHGNEIFERDSHGNQSLDRDRHGNESLDRDSHGNELFERDSQGNQSLDRDRHGNKIFERESHGNESLERDSHGNEIFERDSQGFFPPSIISSSHVTGPITSQINDEESFVPPSLVSGTTTSDLQQDTEIILGEEANSRLLPSISERRSVRVLVTSACDDTTSNIVKSLVSDLGKHNVGCVAYLREELKIVPAPSLTELTKMQLDPKLWLKQTFMQSDWVIMVATEGYLDYAAPKFNLRGFFHWKSKMDHREAQKQIYNLVERKFKKGVTSKGLIPVLINGSKPTDVPDWMRNRYFLFKYDDKSTSVFSDSKLYRFIATQVGVNTPI